MELIVVAGAAMVLLFGARDSTRDVDGFQLDPAAKPRLAEAAMRVAMALDLRSVRTPATWCGERLSPMSCLDEK